MTQHVTFRDDLVALFPGQGSIAQGAGAPWQNSPHWQVVDTVSAATDTDVAELLLTMPTSDVVRTDRAQLATFTLSVLGYLDLLDRGIRPRYLLGHSLGEFSALVASGILSLEDGAAIIAVRGSAMAQAARETAGTMVAVMGASEGARANLEDLKDVWIANINGADQIVLSGTQEGLDVVLANHRDLGWRRATALPVGGAFHSPLMSSAQARLDAALDAATWGSTEHLLVANVDGAIHTDAAEWRALLSKQMTSSVEFLLATETLPESVTRTIEMPPGAVLTGLTKRIRSFEQQLAPASYEEMKEVVL
jgi:[acyl-carrier-protein] S-malonyltransferase